MRYVLYSCNGLHMSGLVSCRMVLVVSLCSSTRLIENNFVLLSFSLTGYSLRWQLRHCRLPVCHEDRRTLPKRNAGTPKRNPVNRSGSENLHAPEQTYKICLRIIGV